MGLVPTNGGSFFCVAEFEVADAGLGAEEGRVRDGGLSLSSCSIRDRLNSALIKDWRCIRTVLRRDDAAYNIEHDQSKPTKIGEEKVMGSAMMLRFLF